MIITQINRHWTLEEYLCYSTLHIVLCDSHMNPKFSGCGFLAHYKNKIFLISVSHVSHIERLTPYINTWKIDTENLRTPQIEIPKMWHCNSEEEKDNLDFSCCILSEKELRNFYGTNYFPIDLDNDCGQPVIDNTFGFCGFLKPKEHGINLDYTRKIISNLTCKYVKPDYILFNTSFEIKEEEYAGCSGAPIFNTNGKIVAIATSVNNGTKSLWGISIKKSIEILDKYIEINNLL